MFAENFTGNKGVYLKIYNYLVKEGFIFSNSTKPIHIGQDRYEFEEDSHHRKMGCHNTHKIKAELIEGEVSYTKEIMGFVCND